MAARKLQQEVEKCFKKVEEGVAEFESIYEKIEQSTNAAQKEKLEDNLKKEIKKLQRLRDQIKTWAASNEIKDKGPLLDKRKLIETEMEKFKAVEKAMKTKAFSKEGLSATAKMDPKEQARMETCDFLGNMVDELERQIETLEAEGESLQATMKKGKAQSTKAERIATIERLTERHKWHQGKLELIKRSLENSAIDTEQVQAIEEAIKYYVSDGMADDYMEDEEMYDELDLQEEEGAYGMNNDNDRVSSQDTQSVPGDAPDLEAPPPSKAKTKSSSISEPSGGVSARRPSTNHKSPLPALATLHNSSTHATNGNATVNMKPAPAPMRAPGETLKYASAAAAAAASEKNNVGIAPLPPPPEAAGSAASSAPLASTTSHQAGPKSKASPLTALAQIAEVPFPKPIPPKAVAEPLAKTNSPVPRKVPTPAPASSNARSAIVDKSDAPALHAKASPAPTPHAQPRAPAAGSTAAVSQTRSPIARDAKDEEAKHAEMEDIESVYHLPSGLQDLLHSFEATQKRSANTSSQSTQRMLTSSLNNGPSAYDVAAPRNYKPEVRFQTPGYYPQDLDPVFDDPRLYARIDPDTLFYVFYYKQGSYQQYLSAKALKDQSWRFHKQYQTWFQRHEEPKTITEEFEQGTYRFFDYESTWMNRRKADFKFAYKFLEDDV